MVLENDLLVNQLSLNSATAIDLNSYNIHKEITGYGSFTIPLDDGSGNPLPVIINLTSGSVGSGAYFEVLMEAGSHPNNANTNNYLERYWTINTIGITNPVYDITLTYASTDVVGSESNIAMGSYLGSLPWTKYSAANAGSNTISASGINETQIDFTGITLAAPTVKINGWNCQRGNMLWRVRSDINCNTNW